MVGVPQRPAIHWTKRRTDCCLTVPAQGNGPDAGLLELQGVLRATGPDRAEQKMLANVARDVSLEPVEWLDPLVAHRGLSRVGITRCPNLFGYCLGSRHPRPFLSKGLTNVPAKHAAPVGRDVLPKARSKIVPSAVASNANDAIHSAVRDLAALEDEVDTIEREIYERRKWMARPTIQQPVKSRAIGRYLRHLPDPSSGALRQMISM